MRHLHLHSRRLTRILFEYWAVHSMCLHYFNVFRKVPRWISIKSNLNVNIVTTVWRNTAGITNYESWFVFNYWKFYHFDYLFVQPIAIWFFLLTIRKSSFFISMMRRNCYKCTNKAAARNWRCSGNMLYLFSLWFFVSRSTNICTVVQRGRFCCQKSRKFRISKKAPSKLFTQNR